MAGQGVQCQMEKCSKVPEQLNRIKSNWRFVVLALRTIRRPAIAKHWRATCTRTEATLMHIQRRRSYATKSQLKQNSLTEWQSMHPHCSTENRLQLCNSNRQAPVKTSIIIMTLRSANGKSKQFNVLNNLTSMPQQSGTELHKFI